MPIRSRSASPKPSPRTSRAPGGAIRLEVDPRAGVLAPAPSELAVLRVDPVEGPVLDHPQLREAIACARLQHATPGLQVWTGPPGVGKTMAAQQLEIECNAAAGAGKEGAYRAHYFATGGEVTHGTTRQMKRGLQSAYEQLLEEELSPADLRRMTEESMARDVIEEARLRNLQLLIVDEAGTKTQAEIRGLAMLSDQGRRRNWPFTVLLVGMDDLATKVDGLPVIRSRDRRLSMFRPWSAEDILAFMFGRAPTFATRAHEGALGVGHVLRRAMEHANGSPREVETLLPELEVRLQKGRGLAEAIDTILEVRSEDREDALAFARAQVEDQRKQRRARMT